MEPAKKEVQKKCVEAMTAVGAATELCWFYADVLQCEYDMMHSTYHLQGELGSKSPLDIKHVFSIIQRMLRNFYTWRKLIENLKDRRISLPHQLFLDKRKLSETGSMKAMCNLQTKQMNLIEGEELFVTDATQPNQLKIRNKNGEEGYVPTLSCILPTPDINIGNAVERLEIQLLTYWSDSHRKVNKVLVQTLKSSLSKLLSQLTDFKDDENILIKRAIKQIASLEKFIKDDSVDVIVLTKILNSLENEILRQNDERLLSLINSIADTDKAVLAYQSFHEQLVNFRQDLTDSIRPIRIMKWDPKVFSASSKGKQLRYYEIKFTTEETTTKEETTYLTPKKLNIHDANNNSEALGNERSKRCVVKSVVDPRNGLKISIKEAVAAGIIDHQSGMYVNPDTGKHRTIPSAMKEGLIQIEYVSSATPTPARTPSIGLITIRSRVENREYQIIGAVDALTNEKLDLDEAWKRGIINETEGYYWNGLTGKRVILDEAVGHGFVLTSEYVGQSSQEPNEPVVNTKTYAVSGVFDQVLKRLVPFVDAIRNGLIDKETGNYVDNASGEKVFAADAIDRGLFKAIAIDDPAGLKIDASNSVIVERVDRRMSKNIVRGVRTIPSLVLKD